jgi:hypothetical protein
MSLFANIFFGLVTGRPGCLLVWDVRLPDPVKIVRLGKEDPPAPIRSIRSSSFFFLLTVQNGGLLKTNPTDLTLENSSIIEFDLGVYERKLAERLRKKV